MPNQTAFTAESAENAEKTMVVDKCQIELHSPQSRGIVRSRRGKDRRGEGETWEKD
jgi:hypothetical protein